MGNMACIDPWVHMTRRASPSVVDLLAAAVPPNAAQIREQKISFLMGMTTACEGKSREEVAAWLDSYEGRA
jgi:hypothetical protein